VQPRNTFTQLNRPYQVKVSNEFISNPNIID
jgi:hypothetical protein